MSQLDDIFRFSAGLPSSRITNHETSSHRYVEFDGEEHALSGTTIPSESANDRQYTFVLQRSMSSSTGTSTDSTLVGRPPQNVESYTARGYSTRESSSRVLWGETSLQTSITPPISSDTPVMRDVSQTEARLAYESGALQLYNGLLPSGILDTDLPFVGDYQRPFDVSSWLTYWSLTGVIYSRRDRITPAALHFKDLTRPRQIAKDEIRGDDYDIQGINWTSLGTTWAKARRARGLCYGKSLPQSPTSLQSASPTFRFRRMKTDHRARLTHFQLRHLISVPSRNDVFYAAGSQVMHSNTTAADSRCVMNLNGLSSISSRASPFAITTLAATSSVLLAGSFNGEYAYLHLESTEGTMPTEGYVTKADTDITNHIQPFASRSAPLSKPLAAFSSNDCHLRILDTATNHFIGAFPYPSAVNASAVSPDARLHAVVGDGSIPWITDAESGKVLVDLCGVHEDHVFAVAWADDGITVATGSQDSRVAIWDARYWNRPLTVIPSTMSCPRGLAFSPVGGGRRLLAIAEAEDVVGIVDAVSWQREDIEFFGSVGGIAIGPDGEELWVANCDVTVGGLMEFQKTDSSRAHDWVDNPALDVRPARSQDERRNTYKGIGRVLV